MSLLNKGLQTAERGASGDENYTPFYAVKPLIKYLQLFSNFKLDTKIWCPFDKPWSAFVQRFKERGYDNIIYSHIDEGQDFFEWEPPSGYDIIISNGPFSLKDKVLKRLFELGKPYAILMPLSVIQGQKRFKYMVGGQVLAFDKRINFHTTNDFEKTSKGAPFASIYFCKSFLPRDFILEELDIKERPLIEKEME